jgi:Ca2+-binding EF-hand superfamily protein
MTKLILAAAAAVSLFAQPPGRGPRMSPLAAALDSDRDGTVSRSELAKAQAALASLDRDKDGVLTEDEVRPQFGPGGREGGERPQEDIVKSLMELDRDGDGKLSKNEVPERMQGLFGRGDSNKDGELTAEELRSMEKAQPQRRDGPDFMRMDPAAAALDADGDRKISAAELAKAPALLAKLDANSDGQLSEDEMRPRGMRGRGDPREMAKHMMEEFDANGDGKLAKAELPDRMRERFDEIDADRDGFVSADELSRMAGRGGPRGERR